MYFNPSYNPDLDKPDKEYLEKSPLIVAVFKQTDDSWDNVFELDKPKVQEKPIKKTA